jgi:Flp pilus assembly protein TadG
MIVRLLNFGQRRRRGVAAIFSLVLLVVLLGFTALTVDVGHIYNVRAELQNAADAAALAGLQMLPDQTLALQTAQEYANMNHSKYGSVVADADVVLGNWDWDSSAFTAGDTPVNAIHVFANRSKKNNNAVNLFFAPIFGRNSTEVSASATAAMGRAQRWDVVISQDVTGSFVDEIDEARLADQGLLDCIHDNAPDTMLGLVTFTGYGQTVSGLKSVNTDYAALSTSIGKIKNCGSAGMPPCSGTNIGAGLDQALAVLATSTSVDLPQAIVLVTDGMPNSGIPGYSDADLVNWAEDSADKADALGISIFTLFYSGNDGTLGANDFLAGLIRGEGTAHETADPAEIGEKLQDICRSGLKAMLVQ